MDKRVRILTELLKRTREGRVDWRETGQEKAYLASFSDFSVQIRERPTKYPEFIDDVLDQQVDYVVSILDSEGKEIERFDDVTLRDAYTGQQNATPFAAMRELYEAARRQALGIEQALDSILRSLSDDGLPF